jgi:hypothetical protein
MMKLIPDLKFLNTSYKQKSGASVTACYGMIIEYFSKGDYTVFLFFKNYLHYYGLSSTASRNLEETITKHLQQHCYYNEKRKLEFVREFHLENLFNSRGYCRVVCWKAGLMPITTDDVMELRFKLVEGGLAMVVYMASHTAYHCVILGYCGNEKKFFKRDPGIKSIQFEDFLLYNKITEYILFENII